ncbi:hypothetical protein CKF54_02500 [Psittacicella hinzii]|uniref:Disulfide bond formation protein B n=1 Tax=Psittacicella hinzii TaxID=2028575 RepID=A0A3A1Y8T6_9GAMM|nr:disulfide bond formation protein B [Psittacicella hinzii]RIY33609.1 hypothetical protein CKF54_02500 [Psittacicella hinzii]
MRFLKRWSLTRFPWFLLFIVAVAGNAFAYILQEYYNILPCYNCVVSRYYLAGVGLAGLLGFLAPKNFVIRFLAILLFIYSSVLGIVNGFEHLNIISSYQNNPFNLGASCPLYFEKLWGLPQEYIPQFFTPISNCESGGPEYCGLNLVQWTLVFFIGLAITSILVLLSQFFAPYKSTGLKTNKSFSMRG